MKRWAEVHIWSCTTLANALVYPDCLDVSQECLRVVVFHLQAKPPAPNGNPSVAFSITNARIADPTNDSDASRLLPAWRELRTQCVVMGEQMRSQPNVHPDFLGFVPAVFFVNSTGIVTHETYPIFRISVRHVQDDPKTERTRKAFDNYIDLLLGAASSGHMFQPPPDPAQLEPGVGTIVQRKKAWKWERELHWDWSRFNDAMSARGLGPMASGLSPRNHFSLFQTILHVE